MYHALSTYLSVKVDRFICSFIYGEQLTVRWLHITEGNVNIQILIQISGGKSEILLFKEDPKGDSIYGLWSTVRMPRIGSYPGSFSFEFAPGSDLNLETYPPDRVLDLSDGGDHVSSASSRIVLWFRLNS